MRKLLVLSVALAMLAPVAKAAPAVLDASNGVANASQATCGCQSRCDGRGERCLITCNTNDAGSACQSDGKLGRNYLRVSPTGVLEVPVPPGAR